jgi:hypothetical protein
LIVTTFADEPETLVLPAFAPAAAALASRVAWRPPPGALVKTSIAGAVATLLYGTQGIGWYTFNSFAPGAFALLFVARGGLMLLVAYAIGMGRLVERLVRGGRPAVATAAALMIVCAVEQGVTTPSFDRFENRRIVDALAARVDPNAGAFLYTPGRFEGTTALAALDAMWAGLERGKPTLNGYSGGTPPFWRPFERCLPRDAYDVRDLRRGVAAWNARFGARYGPLQWIDEPTGPSPD